MSHDEDGGEQVVAQEDPQAVTRLDELARLAGLLPEFIGESKGRAPIHNTKHWLYRAVCVRNGWNQHSLVTQSQFDQAVAAVSNVTV